MTTFVLLLLIFALLVLLLYIGTTKYCCKYWKKQNVPTLGNIAFDILRMHKSSAEYFRDLYNSPEGNNHAFVGLHVFHKPGILLRDPQLIKQVLVRDFAKFNNRYSNADVHCDPIGAQNIFFLKNPMWKEIRLKLTPFFTAARMKHMFTLIDEIGYKLDKYLIEKNTGAELEMKELCARYTTDVIASVAFGVEANTLQNPNGEFRRNGRMIFKFDFWRALEFVIVFFLPQLVSLFRIRVVPKEQTDFFRSTINFVMEQRVKSNTTRHDLIDILVDFRNATKLNKNTNGLIFDGDLLVAQATIFFTAGFESSSALMSFTLYELAKHLELQNRLRQEIGEVLSHNNGIVTSKAIESLTYMQMVISEVLRLYPPLPFLDRECTVQRYSMQPFNNSSIQKGMPVYVPVYGIHMDPKYYPEPTKFNPERFSPENKSRLTPYTYMPFGLGGHACVGERFAMLQTKIGLLYFLRNHRVVMGIKNQQMQINRKALILQADGGIYLKVKYDPIPCENVQVLVKN